MPGSVLITGSNRGIGLEFVRQFADEDWRVYATCRRPAEAEELRKIAGKKERVTLHRLDVTSREDIKAMSWELGNKPLDILLNNAGIYLEKDDVQVGGMRYDDWMRTFEVNTLGAVRVTEGLIKNIAAGRRRLVVVLSSHMGSIADIESPGSYYYRSSKAALNAAMEGIAVALRQRDIGVQILHPGGVATRMGPQDGISAEESVRGMRRIIDGFSMEQSGSFRRYDGSEMPW
ncbi:MAG: SDR family oxidoreductase [Desulfobulbaceae bacterium]|nr:SDR family oxidoreductase [Desulfobulbaceae bacterium]